MRGLLKTKPFVAMFLVVLLSFSFVETSRAFVQLLIPLIPIAARALQPTIKALGMARVAAVGNQKALQMSLASYKAGQNRTLQVSLSASITGATLLAAYMGYDSSPASGGSCKWVLDRSFDSPPVYYPSGIPQDNFLPVCDGSRASFTTYTYVQTIPSYAKRTNSIYVTAPLDSPVDQLYNDFTMSPTQAKTDNLVEALKTLPPTDWDAIVEIKDIAAMQAATDYATGDSVLVDNLGNVIINGVAQEAATYTGSDGLQHTLNIDQNGNVLVDGQLGTGYTASNLSSTATSTKSVTGTTVSSVDPLTGDLVSTNTKQSTDSSGNTSTTVSTTRTNPITGVVTTSVNTTSDKGNVPDASISGDFKNFSYGVGKGVNGFFSPLSGAGQELCYNSKFAGVHCLSDFDKDGVWTSYIRTFFGFVGSMLAVFIPLSVALRI